MGKNKSKDYKTPIVMNMSAFRTALLSAIIPLLSACQSGGLYLANIPTHWSQYTSKTNIAYGDEEWQKLDIYTPPTKGPHPVVVFFYGGGWTDGAKEQYRFVADVLTRKGYMVVIPDYAKYPPATYPVFVEDAALASNWVVKHIAAYGGRLDAVHLLGHSAGAHIGAMLLADKQFLAKYSLKPNIYRSFVGLAGPNHFTPVLRKFVIIFGGEENFSKMQASHFIDGTEPTMLLLHGAQDSIVGEINVERLSKAIIEKNGQVETKIYPKGDHLNIIGSFSRLFASDKWVVADTVAFFNKHTP